MHNDELEPCWALIMTFYVSNFGDSSFLPKLASIISELNTPLFQEGEKL